VAAGSAPRRKGAQRLAKGLGLTFGEVDPGRIVDAFVAAGSAPRRKGAQRAREGGRSADALWRRAASFGRGSVPRARTRRICDGGDERVHLSNLLLAQLLVRTFVGGVVSDCGRSGFGGGWTALVLTASETGSAGWGTGAVAKSFRY
jgi:hypothetical protein